MNKMIQEWGPLEGRVLISLIFLMAGMSKIFEFDGQVGYAASQGVPLATVAIAISIIVEVGGALMIMLGYKARLGATALLVWMIPVTFIMHPFWAVIDPMGQQIQMIMFMKNLALMGAMILIMVHGSGPKSLKAD